jgi:succinate-semialdehyde dehydrogenase/glutarate-semialdehyde dehydrogenase
MTTTLDSEQIARQTLSGAPYGIFIDNAWGGAADGRTFVVTNPATGAALVAIPDAGADETRAAIDAASRAFPAWAATPAVQRAEMLRKVAALMMESRERLAAIMTLEQGKPLSESRGEIAYSASFFAWFAGEGERIYGQLVPASAANKRIMVMRQPVGVCGLITPWNFPAAMLARKIAPALAAGCTVICKPAEQTPLSALEMARIFVQAGVPAGVVNMLPCSDPRPFSDAVFADSRVRKISFTGSTEVGKLLIAQSAATVKRVSMELGGNAPFIVFEDADLDAAVKGALASKFRNAGQTCICANRIFVQRPIYERFVARFSAEARDLRVGDGLAAETAIGPLIDLHARAKVERHIADAVARGAQIMTGGVALDESHNPAGTFWQPTVLANAAHDMVVAQEETFGPVAPIIPFEDEDEALTYANETPFGLASYFYTRDISRVMRVAERLEFGIVGANDALPSTAQAPFGGVKQSGIGSEGGAFGINEYLNLKYVSLGL